MNVLNVCAGEFVQVGPAEGRKGIERQASYQQSNHLEDKSDSGKISLGKQVSLYRADSSVLSSTSSMKGTRWAFSQKIDDDGRTQFIYIPCDNIK